MTVRDPGPEHGPLAAKIEQTFGRMFVEGAAVLGDLFADDAVWVAHRTTLAGLELIVQNADMAMRRFGWNGFTLLISTEAAGVVSARSRATYTQVRPLEAVLAAHFDDAGKVRTLVSFDDPPS